MAKKLCDRMSVGPQIDVAEMAAIAAEGFKSVINCRPDGEEPGQPTSAEVAAAAAAAGLEYAHVPTVPGQIGDEQIAAFDAALAGLPHPVFGYCKSGMRASSLWALTSASDMGADNVIARAADAGYDLSPMAPRLTK